MQMETVAEVGRRPSQILSCREPSIVTNNGKPQNVILNVSGMDIDEVVDMARLLQAKSALRSLRKNAAARGLSSIPDQEIEDEVVQARQDR